MFGRKRIYNPPPAAPAREPEAPKAPPTDEERALAAIREGRWQDVAALGSPAVSVLRRYLNDEEIVATDYDRERARSVLGALAVAGDRSACEALLRLDAGDTISNAGPTVVGPLVSILRDGDPALRLAAVRVLGDLGDGGASEALVARLEETPADDSRSIRDLERALRRCGWDSLPDEARRKLTARFVAPLEETLADPAHPDLDAAVATLADTRDRAAGEALGRLVRHPDARTRAVAVRLLDERTERDAFEVLRSAIRDPVRDVRELAVTALERRGWEPRGDELPWWLVARRMWASAGRIGAGAIDALLAAVNDSDLREPALDAIGGIQDPRAAEPLARLLSGDDAALRVAAARALGRLGDARGAGVLAAEFRDRSDRAGLAGSLAGCGAASAIRDTLKNLIERSTLLLRTSEPADVAEFLRDAAPHLPRSAIVISYGSSSSSDEFRDEREKTYEEPGFLLEGKPEGGDVEKFAVRRTGEGGLVTSEFSGRGDEAFWLLSSGSLLRVTTMSYSMHAGRSSSHRNWAGEAERVDLETLAGDPGRAAGALIRCTQPLLERRLELDAALAPRSSG